jgi:hypothetical protein
MSRLRPRANSSAGKSFRELRDRYLAGVGPVPSPLRQELAERAARTRVHLDPMDQKLDEGHPLSADETRLYEAMIRSLVVLMRELDAMHDLRPALGPLHRASAEVAA